LSVVLEQVVANLVQKVEHRFYGKYRGFVVDNADPELLGRLKVQVPSLLGDEVVSGWAMPCVPYGGDADQGFLFIPEVGAGVWVEFEEGDLEFPIWVGTFWSKPGGESELPKPNDEVQDPPTQKIIKTKKGHTIQLEDADGEEKITIKHKDNSFISIDKDGSVIIGNHKGSTIILNAKDENIVLVEQHGNAVTMTDDGIVIVNKDGSAVVELSGDRVLVAAKEIMLEGSTVTVGAGAANPPPEPAVLGQTFAVMYNTHMHPTAVGPSGPPIPAPLPLGSAPAGQGLSSAVLVK
jgi:uncharacterized protein involved in type VI secretion and phage assembly